MARPRGTGSLYQRKDSAVWWIKYHRNGRSFRESTRTEDKRIATRILGKRLAEISTNTFVGPTHERITVGELADDLFRDYRINGRKTTDDVQTRWRLHIEPFFGSRRVMEVTSDLVAKYVDHRQSETRLECDDQSRDGCAQADVPYRHVRHTAEGLPSAQSFPSSLRTTSVPASSKTHSTKS